MKSIQKAFLENRFVLDVDANSIESIVQYAVSQMVSQGLIPVDRRDEVERTFLQREARASTAIGHSVAVPHAYLNAFTEPVIYFIRVRHPIYLGAPDGIPTRFVFVLAGPPASTAEHLDTLASIARLMADEEFRYDLSVAKEQQDLLGTLERFLARRRPAPGETAPPEGLEYTGRPFGGLLDDLRRRLPYYISDFRNGLHPKCFASTLFLFFACLAPTVTFGGVLAKETGQHIGAVETILATAIGGVVFALFSGQPLNILGSTGPVLIFTIILYRLCNDLNILFLPAYAWVGIWTSAFCILLAIFDASCLMRYFTRFTDEIFAALISMIFIYEAVDKLIVIFRAQDAHQHHDTALLSVLLALGTFYIAGSLSRFRRSRYLLPQVREFLADFGPTIAIAIMTLTAVWLSEINLDVLPAPNSFGTTNGRPWMVNPFDAPTWVWFGSALPALLGTVLVFLDQNITARLVNAPQNRLKEGPAYHWDLLVVGTLNGALSLFGLPWIVAATVRSLNHIRSLATVEEAIGLQGDRRDQIIHVRETRVTGLMIHLLIGASLLLLGWLKLIPMAVLYGLFLFMGVVSMRGNQFFERLSLWFMDRNLYPSTHYLRQVPTWIIHKYTLLQLICLVVLWLVKGSQLGIIFPLFIALLVPVRMLASRYFSPAQLVALDADEEPEEVATRGTE